MSYTFTVFGSGIEKMGVSYRVRNIVSLKKDVGCFFVGQLAFDKLCYADGRTEIVNGEKIVLEPSGAIGSYWNGGHEKYHADMNARLDVCDYVGAVGVWNDPELRCLNRVMLVEHVEGCCDKEVGFDTVCYGSGQ